MADYKAPYSIAGAGSRLGSLYPRNIRFEVIRSFEDGNLLFMHIAQNPDGYESWVTMSLLEICADGSGNMLHQVTNRLKPRINPDRSRVDGPRAVDVSECGHENKAIVREFVDTCFVRGDASRIMDYLDEDGFITHNPRMSPGARSFQSFIADELLSDQPLCYTRVHRVVGQGDFVAVFSELTFRGGLYEAADLFRLKGGRIVEHWDIAGDRQRNQTVSNDMGHEVAAAGS